VFDFIQRSEFSPCRIARFLLPVRRQNYFSSPILPSSSR
jgi:hypothetical protein